MADNPDDAGRYERANWTSMVLLSRQERVRHLAVWSSVTTGPGPICGNRGAFPHFGYATAWPGVPFCTRCVAEVELLALTIRSSNDS